MGQNYLVILDIAIYLRSLNPMPNYKVEGFFGFSYLTLLYEDHPKKIKFDWDDKLKRVDQIEVPIEKTPPIGGPKSPQSIDFKDKNAILEVIKGATTIPPGEYLTFDSNHGIQVFLPLDVIIRIEKGVDYNEAGKEIIEPNNPENLGYSIRTTGGQGRYQELYKYASYPIMIEVLGYPQRDPHPNDLSSGIEHFLD